MNPVGWPLRRTTPIPIMKKAAACNGAVILNVTINCNHGSRKKAIKQNELIVANIQQTTVDPTSAPLAIMLPPYRAQRAFIIRLRLPCTTFIHRVSIDGTFIGSWELKRIAKVLSKVIKFRAGDKEVEK